jgi:hypothetical protein
VARVYAYGGKWCWKRTKLNRNTSAPPQKKRDPRL